MHIRKLRGLARWHRRAAGDTESGQIISGRNPADRFVMGLLRAAADAVLIGAGTFRKSGGHLWLPDRIYPAAAAAFADMRGQLGFARTPAVRTGQRVGRDRRERACDRRRVDLHYAQGRGQASRSAAAQRTPHRARLRAHLAGRSASSLRAAGFARVLTEGGPSLFSELIHEGRLDQLFLTSSPALFGRFPVRRSKILGPRARFERHDLRAP